MEQMVRYMSGVCVTAASDPSVTDSTVFRQRFSLFLGQKIRSKSKKWKEHKYTFFALNRNSVSFCCFFCLILIIFNKMFLVLFLCCICFCFSFRKLNLLGHPTCSTVGGNYILVFKQAKVCWNNNHQLQYFEFNPTWLSGVLSTV